MGQVLVADQVAEEVQEVLVTDQVGVVLVPETLFLQRYRMIRCRARRCSKC